MSKRQQQPTKDVNAVRIQTIAFTMQVRQRLSSTNAMSNQCKIKKQKPYSQVNFTVLMPMKENKEQVQSDIFNSYTVFYLFVIELLKLIHFKVRFKGANRLTDRTNMNKGGL